MAKVMQLEKEGKPKKEVKNSQPVKNQIGLVNGAKAK